MDSVGPYRQADMSMIQSLRDDAAKTNKQETLAACAAPNWGVASLRRVLCSRPKWFVLQVKFGLVGLSLVAARLVLFVC